MFCANVWNKIAKCRVQNVKVKMKGKDTMTFGHTAILQFEIYSFHFALAAAEGCAMI